MSNLKLPLLPVANQIKLGKKILITIAVFSTEGLKGLLEKYDLVIK